MGKAPAFQFYVGDYLQDTRCLSLEARGAWMDLLCTMWRSETRGEISLPLVGYSRLFGCSEEKTEAILTELLEFGVCDSNVTRNADVTLRHKKVTLICRRMKREATGRELAANRQLRFRERKRNADGNGESNAGVTPPSSSSSSSSERESTQKPTLTRLEMDPFDLSESYPPDEDLAAKLPPLGRTIAEVCNYHPDLLTPHQFGCVKLAVERLQKARGFTPEILERFRDYWNAIGKKAHIQPQYITEHFGNYLDWLGNNAKANGYHS